MIRHKKAMRFLAIFLTLCLSVNLVSLFGPLGRVEAGTTPYTAAEMAGKAVDFIHQEYVSGEKIDGYAACALSAAGEDLTSARWTGNKTLKSEIQGLSDLLGDGNSLITYLCSTQNGDGSFGPYANAYGTKAPLQALAAVKNDLTVGSDVYGRVQGSIAGAVNYFKSRYQSGGITYAAGGWDFDYRCVKALAGAGEELSVGGWVYGGTSLRDAVIGSAHAAAAAPSALSAVSLAKELAALYAVDPSSADISVLAGAIKAKQSATDGSFGTSIYDQAMVLTALGKAGQISGIDQAGAFAYIDGLKQTHKDSWGYDAGVAWGSGWTTGFEESDTTAQVMAALSFLTGAGDPSSNVYKAIQDGLTCLADVQDADTAAVARTEGDSTFATAETLIALKFLGKTYDDYAGAASGWVKSSRTKTVAQCLLALNQWNDTSRRDRLAGLLAGRQKTAGPGAGSFENSVYSDMWAYIALGQAGKIGLLDTGGARIYILSKQGADGSWGETFSATYYADVLSTTQAIRALSYLPGASADQPLQEAVSRGLAYLKGLQQADGGVYSAWDDPAVDNSELIITLHRLGEDPAAAQWKNAGGLTPVNYLLNATMNADFSFGSSKNVFGAAEALYALLLTSGQGGTGGGGQTPGEADSCTVYVAVVGQDGNLLFGPDSVVVDKNGRWGLTALGTLDATGLWYSAAGGFVSSIAGQSSSGMNGWMYKVNGVVPMLAASDKSIADGDRVIWWYSKDMNSSGPDWDDLASGNAVNIEQVSVPVPADPAEQNGILPAAFKLSEAALAALKSLLSAVGQDDGGEVGLHLFAGEHGPVTVVGAGQADPDAYAVLKNILRQNVVELVQKITADKGAVIADGQGELALIIPAGALDRDMEITAREEGSGDSPENGLQSAAPEGFRRLSAIFDLGPDGTQFAEPVTIILKVAIPPLVKPERLVLAWYDSSAGRWVAVPAVVDAEKGLITAGVRHFSSYAVLAGDSVKSFSDVTADTCGWAKNPIELLAGAGFVSGVDGDCFEPDRPVTRAEFASLLVRALGIQAGSADANPFKDVQDGRWYADAVKAAYGAGLISGDEDGTFRPDSAITREEVATALARAMKLQPTDREMTFADLDRIAAWAREGVAAAVEKGLIKGFPDGTFRPGDTASRAQCAVMVQQMLADNWGGE